MGRGRLKYLLKCATDLSSATCSGAQMLSREQFCNLAGYDSQALKTLGRRGHLPFASGRAARQHNRYSFFEAFLGILSRDMASDGAVSRVRSAEIVSSLPCVIRRKWDEIGQASQAMVSGSPDAVEILCGWLTRPGSRPVPFCDAVEVIVRNKPIRITATSASRAAAVLRRRALRSDIVIPEEFWASTLDWQPRPEPASDEAKL
jgi:hypothetical protein